MRTPFDYDDDPDRYLAGMATTAAHTRPGHDLYARIVDILVRSGAGTVLDAGCGSGVLAARARGRDLRVLGVDRAAALLALARAHGPVARGAVTALPVADASVDAVVAVNVLDHLADPTAGLRELRRVLRPGGVLVAGAISRRDSPELAPSWRPEPTPFDAEDAPALVRAVFGAVTVHPWDAPLVSLPDRDAVAAYLRARMVEPARADRLATRIVAAADRVPVRVTKRGALVVSTGSAARVHRSDRVAPSPRAGGAATPGSGGRRALPPDRPGPVG